MNIIRIILEYKDLFDDKPKNIDYYLNGISKEKLLESAIYYCSLSTLLDPELSNLVYPFLLECDKGTKLEEHIKLKVKEFLNKKNVLPVILNVRSSLKFFELAQNFDCQDNINLSESDIRERLLKVYLLLNKLHYKGLERKENFNELLVIQSLIHSIYSDTNRHYLRIVEFFKSCLFLKFCESHIPNHMTKFLHEFGISNWQEYVLNVHQLGMLIFERSIENPIIPIIIPIEDENYSKKVFFFDKFCLSDVYHNDKDFTYIKSKPVVKNEKEGEYYVIFEQFFIEKMFKGLYFIFNDINKSFETTEYFIKPAKFRSDFGKKFSEQVLLNKIIKDSIGKKYKHLGYEELQRKGLPDYYIRDGRNIFLFECKDNLISKEVIDTEDVDIFLKELHHIFVESEQGKQKAIKQLINNIMAIRNGEFIEDIGIKPNNNIIYPIIVTHNTIFSLTGINILVNEWFFKELDEQAIDKKNIRNITIININSLILLQGLLSQNEYNLKNIIESYWGAIDKVSRKKFPTREIVISERYKVSCSFDYFVESKFSGKIKLSKEFLKYEEYFGKND
jgi:hypothetical protein